MKKLGTPLNGYIKLYRQMLDWGWYDDTNTKVVFLHLLLTANFKDTEWHGIQLKRGDVVTSIPSLAAALKLSERNVRTAISHLKATGEVTDKTFSKFRIISIKNYSQYQDDDRQSDRQTSGNRQSDDSQATGNRPQRKNDKNVRSKESKNVVVSESCKKVFELFNQTCFSLDSIENPTDLNIRRVSELLQQHPDFNFYDYFIRVEKSDFITGRNGRWNIGGTKATFDWILNSKNIAKIQSGQFDNAEEVHNGTHSGSNEEEDREIDFSKLGEWF